MWSDTGINRFRIKVQGSLLFVFKLGVRRTLVAEAELNEEDLRSESDTLLTSDVSPFFENNTARDSISLSF